MILLPIYYQLLSSLKKNVTVFNDKFNLLKKPAGNDNVATG